MTTDRLGSLIAKKTGAENGPKIMIAGHLDEVGFMVTQITDKGFIRFQTVGGWWAQVMLAQRVTIVTKKGEITGVIGSKPPHIVPNPPSSVLHSYYTKHGANHTTISLENRVYVFTAFF